MLPVGGNDLEFAFKVIDFLIYVRESSVFFYRIVPLLSSYCFSQLSTFNFSGKHMCPYERVTVVSTSH